MVPTALGAVLERMTPGGSSLGGGEVLDPRIDCDADEPLGHVTVAGVGSEMPAAVFTCRRQEQGGSSWCLVSLRPSRGRSGETPVRLPSIFR